jgi:3-methyladenine DNA glycosylase AlkD
MIATFAFIKNNHFDDTIRIAELLLKDDHNLIHKAVGWMLREVGKRDKKLMLRFLKRHHKTMPRVTLSYACERLSPEEKKLFYSNRLR